MWHSSQRSVSLELLFSTSFFFPKINLWLECPIFTSSEIRKNSFHAMNRLDSKCVWDMIPSSFLSDWNLNALFQCKSENVAIWLMKQMTCFGFLSRCREGTELKSDFKERQGNCFLCRLCSFGHCVFCTLLPSRAAATLQGAAPPSLSKCVGRKAHLSLSVLNWSYFFAKL